MIRRCLPKKLYKYREFTPQLLGLIANSEVFYSHSSAFNDPFDCFAEIDFDIKKEAAIELWRYMSKEFDKNYDENYRMQEIEHNASKYVGGGRAIYIESAIKNDIFRMFISAMSSCGVLSLSERFDSTLMWSHYADKHQGICIQYDVSSNACASLKKIEYRAKNKIRASSIFNAKINGSKVDQESIFNNYFFVKSPPWRYEKEWRDVSDKAGRDDSRMEISAIYFGMKCEPYIVTTIVRLLCDQHDRISFFKMQPIAGRFDLRAVKFFPDEIMGCGLRESRFFLFPEIV